MTCTALAEISDYPAYCFVHEDLSPFLDTAEIRKIA